MSDFVFSRRNIEQNKIKKEIQKNYQSHRPNVKEFHGDWGSLGISQNLYHGFDPYENDHYIVVVVGGPILEFRDNSFLNGADRSEGTEAIFRRWYKNEMTWDSDLNGPFIVLIVNKQMGEITCVTDLMSFIPVYSYSTSNNITLSTHVDTLARVTGKDNDLDKVSIADFILHGIVTFPYTTYNNVLQIAPGTDHTIHNGSVNLKSTSYWLPLEKNKYTSINRAAYELRNSLQNYVDKITSQTTNIAQFISGGEDSRVLSALLKDKNRNAYIFLDQMNREGNIAKKVADHYGAYFKLATRSKLHYYNILPSCSDLVGSGSQYHHAHTYGFHKISNLNSYAAVFGGLLADALLKGSHIQKVKGSRRLPFLPHIKSSSYSASTPLTNSIFEPNTLRELTKRRQSHLNYVQKFRNDSAEEWFELWPSSMNKNIANIHANRRLFRSYEPFLSKDVVKISANVPQKWKMNRRLFHKTTKPFLKPTKWLLHADGHLPYYPWYFNVFIQLTTWFYRQIARRTGLIKGNQGPWGEWNYVVNSVQWEKAFANYSDGFHKISSVFEEQSPKELLKKGKLSTHQYINFTQALYQLGKQDS